MGNITTITNILSTNATEQKEKAELILATLANTVADETPSSNRSESRKMAATLSARSEIKNPAKADPVQALQGKIASFKKLVASTPISAKEADTVLQVFFEEAKGLTPTHLAKGPFGHVRTYGMVGLWSLSAAEMRNISSTMDVQQSLMSLEESVESLSVVWSNEYTKMLAADEAAVQAAANAPGSPQDRANAVNVATSKYNFDSTNMSTTNSNFSSQNNLLSNGVSNAGQNLSTDGATIQQVVMKLMDSLSQLIGQI